MVKESLKKYIENYGSKCEHVLNGHRKEKSHNANLHLIEQSRPYT